MSLPADLSLCNLGLEDLDAVIDLVGRCDRTYLDWAPIGWEVPNLELDRARWEESWEVPGRWTKGAVDRSHRLVAMAGWRPDRDADGRAVAGVAHISSLFVDPSRWREGIAAALLELGEDAMWAHGYRMARLWTPELAPARRFYEASGWVVDGRRRWHEALELPVVGYEKRLRPAPAFRR
jgi:GNAT superfamily N-acetyltransferase